MQGKPIVANKDLEQALAHRRRCKALPPLQPGERERLVTAFLAERSVTICPARYAAPLDSLRPPAR